MKKSKVVLIVDDSKIITDRLVLSLGTLPGIENILVVHTAGEAIAMLNNQQLDVTVIDVDLPDRNGIEVLKHIAENRLPVELIIMMSDDESTIRKKNNYTQLGAHHFIHKFFEIDKIEEILASV